MYKLNNLLKTILKIIGFFLLLFIAAFYIFYGKYDLFRFPFDAEVWGNAADWVMAIGTIGSLILILNNLILQTEQNYLNKKMVDMEIEKYLDSITPEFKLRGAVPIYPSKHRYIKNKYISTKYFLEVIKNSLKTARITVNYKSEVYDETKELIYDILKPGQTVKLDHDILIADGDNPNLMFQIIIEMTYFDIKGNKYYHTFNLQKLNPTEESKQKEEQGRIKPV